MAYNNAIPQVTDKFSQSQADLLANFVAIQTFIEVNHVTFGEAKEGKHEKVQFTKQDAAVDPVADEIGIYVKDLTGAPIAAVDGEPSGGVELYLNRVSGGNDFNFPFTAAKMTTAGWCYLPSGIIMKWGEFSVSGDSSGTDTYVTGNDIPLFKAVFHANITAKGGSGDDRPIFLTSYNTTQITCYSARNAKTCTYLIMGY